MSQRLVALTQPYSENSSNCDTQSPVDNLDISTEILDEDTSDFVHLTHNNHNEDAENFLNSSKVNSYCEEWDRLFGQPSYLKQLRQFGLKGLLRSTRFRSVCWKLYLECLPEDKNEWLIVTNESRARYEEINSKLKTNPRIEDDSLDLALNNPLSQAEESPWKRFFQDNELKVTIRQDVIRTFPEIEFFHSTEIREMMIDILFYYAREYPVLSYKQGMHELLAPIIFILHSDNQSFLHASETENLPMIINELMNPEFMEHDAFNMFCQVMDTTEPWYLYKDIPGLIKTSNLQFSHQPFARPQDINPSLVIVSKLTRIHDVILKKHDLELYNHLEALEIAPQIYGIRWLRLLFGREFPLQDLLVLWDAIFSDSLTFDLVDYIFISMLQYLRGVLLNSDYPSCLGYLMRYPAMFDIHYLIEKALYLRDPTHYNAPPNKTFQKPYPLTAIDKISHLTSKFQQTLIQEQKSGKMITGLSTLTKKMTPRPKSLTFNSMTKKNVKANSEPSTLESYLPDSNFGTFSQSFQDNVPSPNYKLRPSAKSQASSDSAANKVDTANFQSDIVRPLKPMSFKDGQNKPFSMIESSGSLSKSEEALVIEESSGTLPVKGNSSLFSRQKGNVKSKKMIKQEEVLLDLAYMQGKINDMEAMCCYCASKMDLHIDRLQDRLLHQKLDNEDEMMVALAGLKQIRDILKGTLKFSQSILDAEDIIISDNHYQPDPFAAEDSDISNNLLAVNHLLEEKATTNHELILLDDNQQMEGSH